MSTKPRVLASTNADDGHHCVDLFVRADGSYGFEVYRRDPEDNRGWYAVGYFAAQVFDTLPEARSAAARCVRWFADAEARADSGAGPKAAPGA